jgi:uncharacterized protein
LIRLTRKHPAGAAKQPRVIIMLIRVILLFAFITPWLPARADAQLVAESIAVPNTEVHSVTTPNGRIYKLYVNLPENYASSGSTMYPVLYLTDAELEVMGIYTGIGYFLRLTGRIRDVILVGIADGSIPVHQGLRRLDYTPTKMPPDSTSGGADEFLTFMRDVAIPLIEDRYRADPDDRGLLGYSFGGLLGAHALLNRPGMFHRFLLTSPSVQWDDLLLVKQAATHGATHDDLPARAYTAFGADERPESIEAWRAFIAELAAPAYPSLFLFSEIVPSADHTTVMPVAFLRGMVTLYGPEVR